MNYHKKFLLKILILNTIVFMGCIPPKGVKGKLTQKNPNTSLTGSNDTNGNSGRSDSDILLSNNDCSKCITIEKNFNFDSCIGSGLIGRICDNAMGDGGYNGWGDSVEIYCKDNLPRFCLTWEKCPWRTQTAPCLTGGAWGNGLSGYQATFTPLIYSKCSPYGLIFSSSSTTHSFMADCYNDSNCPYTKIECSQDGDLLITY